MKIVCIGGGPAGLYFALLMKKLGARHDIVVAPVGDVRRDGIRASATLRTATADAASAAALIACDLATLAAGSLSTRPAMLGSGLRCLARRSTLARGAFATGAFGAVPAGHAAVAGLACGPATLARTRAAGSALLRNRFLLAAHAFVEDRERLIESPVDLCPPVFRRDGPSAGGPARPG